MPAYISMMITQSLPALTLTTTLSLFIRMNQSWFRVATTAFRHFGLNYTGDPYDLNVFVLISTDDTVDSKWNIDINAPSSFGPFGVFVYDGDTTGKNRRNPLRIYIGSATPLTYTDFYEANEDQYMFACHIAGFEDMGGGITEITSAKFALPIPTLIELSKFKAIPANRKVILVWVTESEIDNTGFNISSG